MALSSPIVFSLAGGLAYLRHQLDPPNAVFFLLVAFGAALVGAAVVRLWMGESALSEIRTRSLPVMEFAGGRRHDLAQVFSDEWRDAASTIHGRWLFLLVSTDGSGAALSRIDPADAPVAFRLRDPEIEATVLETGFSEHNRFEIRGESFRFVAVTETSLSGLERERLKRLLARSPVSQPSPRR